MKKKLNDFIHQYEKIINESNNDQLQLENDENDGWDDDVKQILNDLMEKFDGFNYEIRNCIKGVNTGAKNTQELADYLNQLAEQIEETAMEL